MQFRLRLAVSGITRVAGRFVHLLRQAAAGLSLNRVKIWMVGYFVIGMTVLSLASVGGSTYFLLGASGDSMAVWDDYKNITAKKADALLGITASFGDGGLSDSYRRYLLNPTDMTANAVRSSLAGVKKAMAAYRATVRDESLLSNAEKSALSNGE